MSNLMTVTEVAAALNTEPINVERLIARGMLKGNRLGAEGPYRIVDASVAEYVSAGAKDFTMPTLDRFGKFDDVPHNVGVLAENFASTIRDELEAFADAAPVPAAGVEVVTVRPTPGMIDAARSAPPRLARIAGAKYETPFANTLELFAVHASRGAALNIAKAANGRRAPIDNLYRSAADYRAIVDQAAIAAGDTLFVVRKAYPLPPGPIRSEPRQVRFVLPMKSLIEGSAAAFWRRVAELAF